MLALPFDRSDPLMPPAAYTGLPPVAEVSAPDGRRAWLVTSFDAVTRVLTDARFGITPPGAQAARRTRGCGRGSSGSPTSGQRRSPRGPRQPGALGGAAQYLAEVSVGTGGRSRSGAHSRGYLLGGRFESWNTVADRPGRELGGGAPTAGGAG
ncbi:hypothetical protein [Actinomadura sp. CNU-125]|uniref:hypothetical protein n=1 Tax=Actinomadura sp. CNU-125 TaxID=1904961 RepID=UPI0011775A7B|nr:hypothetical protein [Actinomadura sp. CNU-125]